MQKLLINYWWNRNKICTFNQPQSLQIFLIGAKQLSELILAYSYWTIGKKFQCNRKQNTLIFIQGMHLKMLSARQRKLFGPPNVNSGSAAIICEILAVILNDITLWTKYRLTLLKFKKVSLSETLSAVWYLQPNWWPKESGSVSKQNTYIFKLGNSHYKQGTQSDTFYYKDKMVMRPSDSILSHLCPLTLQIP